jgi:2-polyprenyl-6-hydroxyphenyl methylase/3-demethylubiquinone-9 3-methyltransferase
VSGFTFGENWRSFSESVSEESVAKATRSVADLAARGTFAGCTVIDVGCGSGLFSEAFLRLGAERLYAVDLDPECVRLTRDRIAVYVNGARAEVIQASILDPALGDRLPRADLVYAWGSLHHTGAMWSALDRAGDLVKPGGTLVISIYNRHWTSPAWKLTKIVYNRVPGPVQRLMVSAYLGLGRLYNRIVGRTITVERGMELVSDTRDWLGGYPYDYASPTELRAFAAQRSWQELRFVPCQGMTGTNQFVFRVPG